jgi:hypothetical protein
MQVLARPAGTEEAKISPGRTAVTSLEARIVRAHADGREAECPGASTARASRSLTPDAYRRVRLRATGLTARRPGARLPAVTGLPGEEQP